MAGFPFTKTKEGITSTMTLRYSAIIFLVTSFTCDYVAAKTNNFKFSPELFKEVFGEKEIFYAPGTNATVPLLSKSTDTGSLINLAVKDRGSKGVYGWLPCFCFVGVCHCCVDIQMRSLNSRDTSCISVAPVIDDSTIVETGLILNNRTLIQQRVSFDDPRPLCAPFPNFPLISGCIHFNKLRTDNGRIRGCARMEVRISRTDVILWGVQFSCFRVGSDGIVITRPGIPNNTGGNKNKVKPNPAPEKHGDKNKDCVTERSSK